MSRLSKSQNQSQNVTSYIIPLKGIVIYTIKLTRMQIYIYVGGERTNKCVYVKGQVVVQAGSLDGNSGYIMFKNILKTTRHA